MANVGPQTLRRETDIGELGGDLDHRVDDWIDRLWLDQQRQGGAHLPDVIDNDGPPQAQHCGLIVTMQAASSALNVIWTMPSRLKSIIVIWKSGKAGSTAMPAKAGASAAGGQRRCAISCGQERIAQSRKRLPSSRWPIG
jgi:hypothetical protein